MLIKYFSYNVIFEHKLNNINFHIITSCSLKHISDETLESLLGRVQKSS
jgi:hypothetical protein